MTRRIAAEILLLCYEDLARRGRVPPLRERHEALHAETERLSHSSESLDACLSSLGLSPHPGVVLVVEGETEELLVPKVADHIRIPNRAELMRHVVLRGVRGDITKLAAFACAPLIDKPYKDTWFLHKPPTSLAVMVDPEGPYRTPEGVRTVRERIIDEMVAVVRAQGVDPNRDEIGSLVDVSTWTERCFEFEHFTDAELAEALLGVCRDCWGMQRAQLTAAIAEQRRHRENIDNVWRNWRKQPSKRALAERLWPVLRGRIDAARQDPQLRLPAVVEKVIRAFEQAAQRPVGRFCMHGRPLR